MMNDYIISILVVAICGLIAFISAVSIYLVVAKIENRWTPVNRRLPKKSGDYWVCFYGDGEQGVMHYDAKQKAFGYWSECYHFDGGKSEPYFAPSYWVVAWRPLPDKYEEKQ